jgi:hypothetical protein
MTICIVEGKFQPKVEEKISENKKNDFGQNSLRDNRLNLSGEIVVFLTIFLEKCGPFLQTNPNKLSDVSNRILLHRYLSKENSRLAAILVHEVPKELADGFVFSSQIHSPRLG